MTAAKQARGVAPHPARGRAPGPHIIEMDGFPKALGLWRVIRGAASRREGRALALSLLERSLISAAGIIGAERGTRRWVVRKPHHRRAAGQHSRCQQPRPARPNCKRPHPVLPPVYGSHKEQSLLAMQRQRFQNDLFRQDLPITSTNCPYPSPGSPPPPRRQTAASLPRSPPGSPPAPTRCSGPPTAPPPAPPAPSRAP